MNRGFDGNSTLNVLTQNFKSCLLFGLSIGSLVNNRIGKPLVSICLLTVILSSTSLLILDS